MSEKKKTDTTSGDHPQDQDQPTKIGEQKNRIAKDDEIPIDNFQGVVSPPTSQPTRLSSSTSRTNLLFPKKKTKWTCTNKGD